MKPDNTLQKDRLDDCHIILTGDLSIRNYQAIQHALQPLSNAAAKEKDVLIQFPMAIDLSFIQLLASIKKHEESKGTRVNIKTELKEEHYHLLAKTGWLTFLNVTNFNQSI